jgi:hypothetical protein
MALLAEDALLGGVGLRDQPPGTGTYRDILLKYRLRSQA